MDNNKKLLEGLLKADGIDPAGPTEAERIAFAKILDKHSKTKKSKPGSQPNIWRIITKSRITKLTAAAVIIIVVIFGINHFGGSVSIATTAYAAAVKALQNVDTVHIFGWTTKVFPRHTTVFDETLDTSKQYTVETWEWFTENGERRKYDCQGPITFWDDGERCYEYQIHNDTLYIGKSSLSRPLSEKFQSMVDKLESLKELGIKITNLENRMIGDSNAKGFRTERDDRRYDIWIDSETNLVLQNNAYSLKEGQWMQWGHRSITYDQKVPPEILAYVPPETKNIQYDWEIDPRFEKWHLRLREIEAYYQLNPLPTTMELLPRKSDEQFEAYSEGLSGVIGSSGYWVQPLPSSLGFFLRGYIQLGGSLRIPSDLQKIKLNHDLVTHNKFSPRERADFVLDNLGLEIIEITEDRKIWVAHWDGRPLKPLRDVKAPVPNPDNLPLKAGMVSTWGRFSMKELFDAFVYWQNLNLKANNIIIVDETGLPSPSRVGIVDEKYAVSSESPFWGGSESIEIARKWFEEEFGVTFTEEIRPMTIYVVQRKDEGM